MTEEDTYWCELYNNLSMKENERVHGMNETSRWNSTWGGCIYDPLGDAQRWTPVKVIVICIYLLVLVGGLIGNSVVVFLVVWHRHMLTVTNVFIANLALSDIALCTFCLPLQLHYQLTDDWVFGSALCRVVFGSFAIPIGVSTLGLFLIALDRYWNIVYPLRRPMTHRQALFLIAISITVSVLLSLPVMFYTSLVIPPEIFPIRKRFCAEEWPSDVGRLVYTVAMFLFQFSTPLCLSATLYYKIYTRLNARLLLVRRDPCRRQQRTNRILVAIVSLFVICWLPWNLLSLVIEINHQLVKGVYLELIDMLLKAFALGSACVNPFLYCWLNDNFRRELNSAVVRLRLCGSAREPVHQRQQLSRYQSEQQIQNELQTL